MIGVGDVNHGGDLAATLYTDVSVGGRPQALRAALTNNGVPAWINFSISPGVHANDAQPLIFLFFGLVGFGGRHCFYGSGRFLRFEGGFGGRHCFYGSSRFLRFESDLERGLEGGFEGGFDSIGSGIGGRH